MTQKWSPAGKPADGKPFPALRRGRRIALLFVFGWVAFVAAQYWVFDQIQKRIEIQISGIWVPSVWKPAFKVRQAAFQWKERIRLLSGDVEVEYDPLDLWVRRNFRIRLSSTNARIQFLGDWSKLQGGGEMAVEKLFADIALDTKGLKEIYAVEVKSPSYQFQIQHR